MQRKHPRLFAALVGASCGAALLVALVSCARAADPQATKQRILTASGVRVRSASQVSAPEVSKLQIGTVVTELEQSATVDTIGSASDHWYRVGLADGREGWIFGGFTAPFEASRRAEIYGKIASERLAST